MSKLKTLKDLRALDFIGRIGVYSRVELRQEAIKWIDKLKNQLKKKENCSYCNRKLELYKFDPDEYFYQCLVWNDPGMDSKLDEIEDEYIGSEKFTKELEKHDSEILEDHEIWILAKIEFIEHFFNITKKEVKNVQKK